jgi:excisionase family DNA binding protein
MPEIMTPKEVASYLKMSVLTVYKHAKQGTIPGFRVGNSWRFDKKKIDEVLLNGGDESREELKSNTGE